MLRDAVMGLLSYPPDATVADVTVGFGGHAEALGARLGESGLLIGWDVDPVSLEQTQQRLSGLRCEVRLERVNFGEITALRASPRGVACVDVILADLGVNSAQLAAASYGLSFQQDGPLDMRLDDRLVTTAADLVNSLPQEELANVLYRYGEERRSRAVARTIVAARRRQRITRTGELADLVVKALGLRPGGGRRGRIHPATRTFQALRIAVNDELGQLQRLLDAAPEVLRVGGQIAVISFHSLEDRLVKQSFKAMQTAGRYEIITKKPVTADERERRENPRSRSAKLRVAQKVA